MIKAFFDGIEMVYDSAWNQDDSFCSPALTTCVTMAISRVVRANEVTGQSCTKGNTKPRIAPPNEVSHYGRGC